MDKRDKDFAAELANWPGVDYYFDKSSRKHFKIVLTFNGASRFMVYSCSASDHRAFMNQMADLRRICRSIGAERKDKKWKLQSLRPAASSQNG